MWVMQVMRVMYHSARGFNVILACAGLVHSEKLFRIQQMINNEIVCDA